MLSKLHVHPTIPVADLDRAKKWYKDKLGLEPSRETPGGLMYDCADGSWFLLFPTSNAGTAKNTAAGWVADDLEKEVAELRAKGVVFEEYEQPKTVNGIATWGKNKSAWFKDSEGNTLGLVQFA